MKMIRAIWMVAVVLVMVAGSVLGQTHVVFRMLEMTGSAQDRTVTVSMPGGWRLSGTNLFYSPPVQVVSTNGQAETNLFAGRYSVTLKGIAAAYTINVVDTNRTIYAHEIIELTPDSYNATAFYTKPQVDAMIATNVPANVVTNGQAALNVGAVTATNFSGPGAAASFETLTVANGIAIEGGGYDSIDGNNNAHFEAVYSPSFAGNAAGLTNLPVAAVQTLETSLSWVSNQFETVVEGVGAGTTNDPWTGWESKIRAISGMRYTFKSGCYLGTNIALSPAAGVLRDVILEGQGPGTVLMLTGSTNTSTWYPSGTALVIGSGGIDGFRCINCTVKNLKIDGCGSAMYGLMFDNVSQCNSYNVRVTGVTSSGFHLLSCVFGTHYNPTVCGQPSHSGLAIDSGRNPTNGIFMGRNSTTSFDCTAQTFININVDSCTNGVYMTSGEYCQFLGGSSEYNSAYGLYICPTNSGLISNNHFIGTDFEGNGLGIYNAPGRYVSRQSFNCFFDATKFSTVGPNSDMVWNIGAAAGGFESLGGAAVMIASTNAAIQFDRRGSGVTAGVENCLTIKPYTSGVNGQMIHMPFGGETGIMFRTNGADDIRRMFFTCPQSTTYWGQLMDAGDFVGWNTPTNAFRWGLWYNANFQPHFTISSNQVRAWKPAKFDTNVTIYGTLSGRTRIETLTNSTTAFGNDVDRTIAQFYGGSGANLGVAYVTCVGGAIVQGATANELAIIAPSISRFQQQVTVNGRLTVTNLANFTCVNTNVAGATVVGQLPVLVNGTTYYLDLKK